MTERKAATMHENSTREVVGERLAGDVPASWQGGALEGLFERLAATVRDGAVLRETRGRRTVAAAVDGRRLVVKRFVGDEPRDWWHERLRGEPRSPARREAAALAAARAAGLAVPRPLVWCGESPARLAPPRPGSGATSFLVLEWVDHATHLARALAAASAAERTHLVRAAVDLVARFHAAGFVHRDLYAPHFVIERASGALVLLDLGRARRCDPNARASRRRFVKDLAALHATLPAAVGAHERRRALLVWCERVLGSRAAARELAPAIEHKARALFAHTPIDPGTDRVDWPREVVV
jgi:tRNA A-37 threonylcarbamoyl transferase component Bud32